ncbi:hypothetical protein JCGZ_16198 [Jatropha curcas]|uniref:Uncharacterized protein n=1 Tax=Jatropha curcas TaxID=180498 RepID=A0A067K6H7_JATCU|nr:homeobox protein Hox-B3 [Jatropha curcas]KDP30633.1 hypothetical protein JCGZ_16198 [Jatropha curcas]
MDSAKFEDNSSPVDSVSPEICNSGALSATGMSHASPDGFVKRPRVSYYPGLPSNERSVTHQGAANYGANGGGGAGAGAGGGGQGGQGGGGSGRGGGGGVRVTPRPKIPILLRTPQNELYQLYEIELYSNMNLEQVLALLHHYWCLYTNQQPRQNVSWETVWPGYIVKFSCLRHICNPYPDEEDFMELDFDGDWSQFRYGVERIIVVRLA